MTAKPTAILPADPNDPPFEPDTAEQKAAYAARMIEVRRQAKTRRAEARQESIARIAAEPTPKLSGKERRMAALEAILPDLRGRTQGFAISLCQQYRTKGALSGKQWHWVRKLAADHKPKTPESTLNDAEYDELERAAESDRWLH